MVIVQLFKVDPLGFHHDSLSSRLPIDQWAVCPIRIWRPLQLITDTREICNDGHVQTNECVQYCGIICHTASQISNHCDPLRVCQVFTLHCYPCDAAYVSLLFLYCFVLLQFYSRDSTLQKTLAMLHRHLPIIIFACLISSNFAGAVLPGRSTDSFLTESSPLDKRQPATIQQQGNINVVSTPGQQTQNATGTAGEGNGTDPDPGVITNPGETPTSDEVNCTDVTTGRDNKCWKELGLTQWVEEWVDTRPCYSGEAFSSCFLRKEGFPGLDCTGIKIDTCTSPQGDNVLKKPEVFYVAYNIYGQ